MCQTIESWVRQMQRTLFHSIFHPSDLTTKYWKTFFPAIYTESFNEVIATEDLKSYDAKVYEHLIEECLHKKFD